MQTEREHTTHFDDCGCKSKAFQSRIDTLEARLKKVGEKVGMIQESAEVLAADTSVGFVNQKLAKSIAALAHSIATRKD